MFKPWSTVISFGTVDGLIWQCSDLLLLGCSVGFPFRLTYFTWGPDETRVSTTAAKLSLTCTNEPPATLSGEFVRLFESVETFEAYPKYV